MSKTAVSKITALVVILGGSAYFALSQRQARPLSIGDSAPDFSVPAAGSGSLHWKDYSGRIVVLNFWATWCPPCVEETPSLVRFAEKMRDHGVMVISVSVDEDAHALQDFIEKYHLSYPVGRDPDRSLAARFGTKLFPETYIFDRRGQLAEKIADPADWDDPRIQTFVLDLARSSQR
jgi:peroxiredoxin